MKNHCNIYEVLLRWDFLHLIIPLTDGDVDAERKQVTLSQEGQRQDLKNVFINYPPLDSTSLERMLGSLDIFSFEAP